MTAEAIRTLYLIALALESACDTVLSQLNLGRVRKNSGAVPEEFRGAVDEEQYRRSCTYTQEKGNLSIFSSLTSALIAALLVVLGVFGMLDETIAAFVSNKYVHGLLFFASISVLLWLLNLPFELYATFSLEERFGFNRVTPKLWAADTIKGFAVSAVLGGLLGWGLLALMSGFPESWWLICAAFLVAMQLVIIFIFPRWIAPLFNKFSPLEQGSLRNAIEELAARAGFSATDIQVMDGSKRSAHANAYFTGFGKSKRIVLFDTLLQTLEEPETVSVLAHEIGHEKHGHIWQKLLVSFAFTFAGFWVLGVLAELPALYEAFGFLRPSNHAALFIFTFGASPFMYFIAPLINSLSRRHEYQADSYAARFSSAEALTSALLKISKRSLSNLTPHPWYSFVHYSHPVLSERLAALRAHNVERE